MRQAPQIAVNGMYPAAGYAAAPPQHASELDAQYWKNMFLDLGFGGTAEQQQQHPSMAGAMPPQSNGGDPRAYAHHHQNAAYHIPQSHPGYSH